ncbi:hypothetical protein [Paucibacter sp. Y2R2-4]|uniref:hypothetical protein n=1 Tax=Paucibacter sp. Y2R2-4 TaxID=2893553 RepID=UPI0021E42933|nr:hypothetical protein [Paucibacter sp. Y2R2-4]MCV2349631.1 hypothetical protein [Paucibacter sp. Y2R2-4]
MKRRTFLTATSGLLALNFYGIPAKAAGDSSRPKFAALSLIGNTLNVITYRPTVGTKLDSNLKQSADLPGAPFDITALRTIQSAIGASDAGRDVLLYTAPKTELFGRPGALFDGDQLRLPNDLAASMKKDGATHLVLVTRSRHEAQFKVTTGTIGTGQLEGIGFYIDRHKKTRNLDSGEHSFGYLAPFVCLQLSLVELSSAKVLRQETINASKIIGTVQNPQDGLNPWQALSNEEKVSTLDQMIERELQFNTAKLIEGI